MVGADVGPGLDETLVGVELFFGGDGAGGDVVPGFFDGVVEVMPADFGEEKWLALSNITAIPKRYSCMRRNDEPFSIL